MRPVYPQPLRYHSRTRGYWRRRNENYGRWERLSVASHDDRGPWYLDWEPDRPRKNNILYNREFRTGAYRRLVDAGRDLHELHALMAPGPSWSTEGRKTHPNDGGRSTTPSPSIAAWASRTAW